MGPEDHLHAAAGQALQQLCALRCGGRAREQAPANAGLLHQRAQLGGVLAGEHLGGRHHGRLPAAVCRQGAGKRRDDGLAAAHIAQQHAVHGLRRLHVRKDLARRATLVARELKGQAAQQRLHARAAHMGAGASAGKLAVAAHHHLQLQAQQLLVGQAAARLLELAGVAGEVHGPQRGLESHEAPARPQARGQGGCQRVAQLVEGVGHQAAHPRGRDALAGAVHGHHALGAVIPLAQHLDKRRAHLAHPVVEGDLPRGADAVPRVQGVDEPGLLEPHQGHGAGFVDHRGLDDVHAGARLLLAHALQAAHHAHRLAQGRACAGDAVGEVDVAVGIPADQVAHGGDAQLGQGLGAR